MALVTFCAYWLSFRVNALVSPWAEYAPGASLIFLPAGVKLVALLVAGGWGALGLAAAAALMASDIWTTANFYELIGNIVVWLGVPYVIVESVLRIQGVKRDLSNLTFTPLLFILVAVTVVGSAASSAYAVFAHGRKSDDYLAAASAMAVGDFVGAGLMLILAISVLKLLKKTPRQNL